MLRLDKVSKYYHTGNNIVLALRNINLSFKIGEFVAITGESGSGKSTLLNVISGLDTYEEGKLYINDKDMSHYTVEELEHYRKDYIGFVFQDYNIIDSYTVYQNIDIVLSIQGYSKTERKKKVMDLIKQVGLQNQTHQKAIKLSGGEKQRTVIARSLAKESPILVCDEPTGNLDIESSKSIMKLLSELSKNKLVIVVTHDFSLIKDIATRKVRIYDGEVVEDTTFKMNYKETNEKATPKNYKTKIIDVLRIAFNNVFSVPKKSIFTMIILMFMISILFFSYSNVVSERNKPYTSSTNYFNNTHESRIIVTKGTNELFSQADIEEIAGVDLVRTVINNDVVFDTRLINTVHNDEYDFDEFYYYKILSAKSLDEFDLISGSLPVEDYEVVIGDNGVYEVGDYINVANSYRLREYEGLKTNQFVYKIVGITSESITYDDPYHTLYFSNNALLDMAWSSIYESSQIYLKIEGTEIYDTPNERWITPLLDGSVDIMKNTYGLANAIWIDNSLEDNVVLTFDMMFFDMCRDFGFKKEVVLDMDAGLCNADDFIDAHEITISTITAFENDKQFDDFVIISDPSANSQLGLMYMNEATYQNYFGENSYQVTAIVHNVFDGKMVVEDLEELGYKVFYPSIIVDDDDATSILLNNIKLSLFVVGTITGIYFVGYFVIRNVIMSKQKDYIIFRSVGSTKNTIKLMLQAENFYLTIISTVIVMTVLIILELTNNNVPDILRYLNFKDYMFIFASLILVIWFMTRNFSKKLFEVSVISSLKGTEQ